MASTASGAPGARSMCRGRRAEDRSRVKSSSRPQAARTRRRVALTAGLGHGWATSGLFQVQVRDRSIARYTRQRQSVVAEFTIEVLSS